MTTAPAMLSTTLRGRRIVLALDRRAEDLAAALERHGAEIHHAPALSMIPHVDDPQLLATTRELLADPPSMLVVTTGVGLRGWFEAAESADVDERLREALAGASVIARGPKARGAAQQAGLAVDWVAENGTSAEIAEHLSTLDLQGVRVAVQHHGSGADGLDEHLAALGAEVVNLTVYRWGPPRDPAAVHRSVLEASRGEVDAVLFTAAPGTENWLQAAEAAGVMSGITEHAEAGDLLFAAVGPLTAGPLVDRGLPALLPERSRMGALVRAVVQHYTPDVADAPADPAGPRGGNPS